jgi:hypothetical protein
MVFPTIQHPARAIRLAGEIAGLLAGRLHRGRGGPRVAPPSQTLLHALFTPELDAFDSLAGLASHLLDRCLVIEDPSTPHDAGRPASGKRQVFATAFRSALSGVLNTHRQGHDPAFTFAAGAAGSFERELRAYELECDKLPVEPGVSARGLPISLAWAMGMLSAHLPSSSGLTEAGMVETAFAVARLPLARHVEACHRLRASGVVAGQLRLAGRIVAEVTARAPCGSGIWCVRSAASARSASSR